MESIKISLKDVTHCLLEKIRIILKSKSKNKFFLDSFILIIFSALFFSIPACSFSPELYLITWILTFALLFCILLEFVFYLKFSFDVVHVSLLIFIVAAIVSTFLNKFINFSPTYIYLTFFIIFIYSFVKAKPNFKMPMVFSAYVGTIAFLFLFVATYFKELISFDLDRLGTLFGDVNDIAIYNSLGAVVSLFCIFKFRNLVLRTLNAILFILFSYCSISSGSKIAIFLLAGCFLFLIIYFNGKKKYWLSIIEISIMIVLIVVVLSLPFASSLRERLLSMFNLFSPEEIPGAERTDGSTIGRMQMIINALNMFLRKPLFGYGINGFANFGGMTGSWSHNHLAEVLCNTGAIGFITYHIPVLLFFSGKSKKNPLMFLLLIFFVISSVSIVLVTEKMFAFLIGVIYASDCNDYKTFFSFKISNFLLTIKK